MTPEQWAVVVPAMMTFVTALTALVTAIISDLNRRTLKRVERAANGNLSRLADHLEQARLEVLDLAERRQHEVAEGRRVLARRRRHKTASGAGRKGRRNANDAP